MFTEARTGSILSPISPDAVLSREDIRTAARSQSVGFVTVGYVPELQKDLEPDENGIAYVDMNRSGRMKLDAHKEGVIATAALSGCIGVAGFARHVDGTTLQFVSHYDPMSQHYLISGRESNVNDDLYGFRYNATRSGRLASELIFLVAYDPLLCTASDYGQKQGEFKKWHCLDQISTTAERLGAVARVLLLPYDLSLEGHTLAAGRCNGVEGIFWDEEPIDFDKYPFSTTEYEEAAV